VSVALDRGVWHERLQRNNQKALLDALMESLYIEEGGTHLSLMNFGTDVEETVPLSALGTEATYNVGLLQAEIDTLFQTAVPKVELGYKMEASNLALALTSVSDALYSAAADASKGAPNPTIIIVGDGKTCAGRGCQGEVPPWEELCEQRDLLRQTMPELKVLCMTTDEPDNRPKAFRCACDGVWTGDKKANKDDARYVADQMRNFVCEPSEKRENPCTKVNFVNADESQKRTLCRKVMRTNRGEVPSKDRPELGEGRRHCYWSGSCRVMGRFSTLYEENPQQKPPVQG
jgi:hypothetical protein